MVSNYIKPANGQVLTFYNLDCIRHWRNYVAHYVGIHNETILDKIQAPKCDFDSLVNIIITLKEEMENSDIFNDMLKVEWDVYKDLEKMQELFLKRDRNFRTFKYPR